jgi:hypothetical protein
LAETEPRRDDDEADLPRGERLTAGGFSHENLLLLSADVDGGTGTLAPLRPRREPPQKSPWERLRAQTNPPPREKMRKYNTNMGLASSRKPLTARPVRNTLSAR